MTPHRRFIFLNAAALILLLALALRFIAWQAAPLFIDEAMFVEYGTHIRAGEFFYGMHISRWLYTWITGWLATGGAEGPAIGRLAAILISPLACAVTMGFGWELGRTTGRREAVALLAGLIYALMPMALLHERFGMYEAMMNALTMAGALAALRLMRQPGPGLALAAGLALAGGAVTKINALPYLVLPGLAWLLLPRRDQRLRAGLWGLAALMLAAALTAAVFLGAGASGYGSAQGFRPDASTTLLGGLSDPATLARITEQSLEAWQGWRLYMGIPLLALAIVSPLLGTLTIQPQTVESETGSTAVSALRDRFPAALPALYLLALALAFAPAPILIDQPTSTEDLPARYFIFSAAPLAALASASIVAGAAGLRRAAGQWPARLAAAVALALLLIPYLRFDLLLFADFNRARLELMTDFDELQYSPFISGWARQDLARWMLDQQALDGRRLRVLVPEADLLFYQAWIGPRLGSIEVFRYGDVEQAARVAGWIEAGDAVYIVENAFAPLPPDSHGRGLALLTESSFEDWTFRLYAMQ